MFSSLVMRTQPLRPTSGIQSTSAADGILDGFWRDRVIASDVFDAFVSHETLRDDRAAYPKAIDNRATKGKAWIDHDACAAWPAGRSGKQHDFFRYSVRVTAHIFKPLMNDLAQLHLPVLRGANQCIQLFDKQFDTVGLKLLVSEGAMGIE